jgi:stage II sporulation protein AA (anti-sigma F factor antagonist)
MDIDALFFNTEGLLSMANSAVHGRQKGTLGILDFNVDVGAQSYETAFRAQNDLTRAHVAAFVLNFSNTKYITSTGIGLIITLVEAARQAGRDIYAYGVTSHYERIFDMAGLLQTLRLFGSEEEIETQIGADAPVVGSAPDNPAL